ncbi:MAG: hypothetical protein WAU86_08665 [Oricola sp.]
MTREGASLSGAGAMEYSEATIRLGAFLGIFVTMAILELRSPRPKRAETTRS